MGYRIIEDDITKIDTDIIVNASNGIGYMGGLLGKYIKLKGVAEAIHYKTKGVVEKEAKEITSERNYKAGEIFVTHAGCLNAFYILHAVTMDKPGSRTTLEVVKELLPKIMDKAKELDVEAIAIPLLGAGTGGVDPNSVLNLYKEFFSEDFGIDVTIVAYSKKKKEN